MSDKEDRIAKLSQRFKTHASGRPKNTTKNHERQSFYLDTALTEQIDKTYKTVSHQLYPKSISKSVFLETIFEYGLENLETVKSRLVDIEETGEHITPHYLRQLIHLIYVGDMGKLTHVFNLRQ